MQHGEVFLLRVGRHSGAESVTLNGVRDGHIKIKLDKDSVTKKQRYAYESEARTLWLASNDKDQMQNLLPFGWLLVEVQMMTGQPQDWPEIKIICEPHLVDARALAARLEEKQAAVAQARSDAEKMRREETEKARLHAEEEARQLREEEDKRARLAAMTPNMLRIEEFISLAEKRIDQLRGRMEKPNTEFHQRAQKLAKDALSGSEWMADERHAAADAITEWLPRVVQGIDKSELKKLNLSKLRGDV